MTVTEGVECDQTLRLHIAPGVRVVSKRARSTRTNDSIIVGFLPLPIILISTVIRGKAKKLCEIDESREREKEISGPLVK